MDVEKNIEFILEQQAGFVVHLQQLGEIQSRQQGILDRVLTIVGQLGEAAGQLAEAQQRTDQTVRELAEAQQRTDQKLREVGEKLEGVADNLNALIKVVDELVRRNGRK